MHFSKMHGLGNDFMIVDAITQKVFFSQEKIRNLSDRHFGIGFDQLLIVDPPYDPELDFHYRIFNSDGSKVTQCGNGARCFALFVKMKNLTNKKNIHISTQTGRMILNIIDDNLVQVNMGEPTFDPKKIPFLVSQEDHFYIMNISEQTFIYNVVSIGNPHCVIMVNNVDTAQVTILGSILENHELFPERVNISFIQIINRQHIRLRVYERGSGETLACGSGACAAVAVGFKQGILSNKVQVDLPGGYLIINWCGPGQPLYMTGPATHVYDGYIHL